MDERTTDREMTGDDLRAAQRQEALARLGLLETRGLHRNVRAGFERGGRLSYSERVPLGYSSADVICWLDGPSAASCLGRAFADVVREFEEESGSLVYHATHELLAFGEILDLFHVSAHPEEWEQDRADLEEGYAFVRAVNLSDERMSDLGTIGFAAAGGGLVRTA